MMCVLGASCTTPTAENQHSLTPLPTEAIFEHREQIDTQFMSKLSSSGVLEAAYQIGLDVEQYLKPLAQRVDHNYRQYRWSVGYHENGGILISALPPEEEIGWTPWERWYQDDHGDIRKESLVMYPLRNTTDKGIARWYKLDESDLMPRYLRKSPSLEDQLKLARIDVAASIIGFDAKEVLLASLSKYGRNYYAKCRWVVISHILGEDGPVIYILPPMDNSDHWPWESWYTDGKTPIIHHVHFTKKNNRTTGVWKEYLGAPQRPPEIFGLIWYWYDDTALLPTMADMIE